MANHMLRSNAKVNELRVRWANNAISLSFMDDVPPHDLKNGHSKQVYKVKSAKPRCTCTLRKKQALRASVSQ
jgi:hypothetical protein